jgi:thiol:disulfide interchange protein DsbD
MHTLKVSLGFVMLAAALKFFSNTEKALGLMVLPRELFLVVCAAVLLVWSLYLLGIVRLKGETAEGIGSLRMLGGLVVLTLAAYLAHGARGFRLDAVTTAFAPNYPAERVVWDAWTIVEDDLEAGLARARADGKRALLNFTGITCVNCQQMEAAVFPKLEAELGDYVEVRLHTDKVGSAEAAARSQRFQDYKVRLTKSQGNPIYVVVDPDAPEVPIDLFAGKDITGGVEFGKFLRRNAGG